MAILEAVAAHDRSAILQLIGDCDKTLTIAALASAWLVLAEATGNDVPALLTGMSAGIPANPQGGNR
ncbi:hypothetical protein [Nocardia sp. NBC_01388]|uniref:hypothetical protein n=1 Tax=Nocardia sp. NBC_01388 TaxID=2903596 RepID=UPI00324AE7A2